MIQAFEGNSPQVNETAYISPMVVIVGDVTIGADSSVWFQSVLRGDINSVSVGEKTNIQDGCILHVTKRHAVKVGARVTVGHRAVLHGCTIGDDCLIAMGAIVLDGAVVENGAMVGAGALVPPGMVVKAGTLVLGSPAKPVRELRDDDRERIAQGWQNYIDYAKRFRKELG